MQTPNEFEAPTTLAELDTRVEAALDTIRGSGWVSWADAARKRYDSDVRYIAERDISRAEQWLQNVEATARMREGRTRGSQL